MSLLLLPLLLAPLAVQALPSVLVYTRTAGYRHDSIPTAIQALSNQSTLNGGQYEYSFTFSEDPDLFTDDGLKGALSASVLDATGKTAFQNYLDLGGAFMGVHAASAALFNTSFYQREVGALFDYHPTLQEATFVVINDTNHPATAMLPPRWTFEEEVYYFRSDPRANGATLLLTVDEDSYNNTGGTSTGYYGQGDPHPIAWYQERGNGSDSRSTAGRSFYTSLGHSNETWHNVTFMSHIMEGLKWTLDGNTTLAFTASGSVGNGTDRIDPTTSSTVPSPTGSSSISPSASSTGGTSAGFPVLDGLTGGWKVGVLVGALAVGAFL